MGSLPRRSTSTALTVVLTTAALIQPLIVFNRAAMAQDADAGREIEFTPQNQNSNQVITAPQGSFGRSGLAGSVPATPSVPSVPSVPNPASAVPSAASPVPSSPVPVNPAAAAGDTPLATSTFSNDRSTQPGGNLSAPPATNIPQPLTPTVPSVSQAVPSAPAPPPVSSPASPNTDVPEPLPPIGVPNQPVSPQPAPDVTAGATNQADIPTSYDYQRPTENVPTSTAFVSKGQLPEGTVLPLATFRDTKFGLNQEVQVNLSVMEDVADAQGRVIVPAGSTVWGRFEPIMEETTDMVGDYERTQERMVGSRFIAERIDIQSASHTISGISNTIPAGFDPDADVDRVALRNAGFGVLGGVALGVLTGGAGFLPLMAIGGASGAMAGAASVDNVVALNGDTVVELTLDQAFISN